MATTTVLTIQPDWNSIKELPDLLTILKIYGFQAKVSKEMFNSMGKDKSLFEIVTSEEIDVEALQAEAQAQPVAIPPIEENLN